MPLSSLQGFSVGITAGRRAEEQAELLERRGATVVFGPAISTEYLGSDTALRAATEAVIASRPTFLVVTTGIGVRAWFEAAQTWGLAAALTATLRAATVCARGPKAAGAIRAVGLDVHITAPTERLDELMQDLSSRQLANTSIAFQHYGAPSQAASAVLRANGAAVIDVPVYQWRMPDDTSAIERLVDAACSGEVHAVTFTSAPALANFVEVADASGRRDALLDAFNERGVVAACVGPVCAEAAIEAGIDGPVAPSLGRLGLLVRTLDDTLQHRRHTVAVGQTTVAVQGRVVAVGDEIIELTPREQAVLDALFRRRGAVVSKAVLLREVWADAADAHAVEATVGRLRRRLGDAGAIVRSVRGRGYMIDSHTDVTSV